MRSWFAHLGFETPMAVGCSPRFHEIFLHEYECNMQLSYLSIGCFGRWLLHCWHGWYIYAVLDVIPQLHFITDIVDVNSQIMRDSDNLTDAPRDPLPAQATIKSVNKISPLSETDPLGTMEAWFSFSFMEVGEVLVASFCANAMKQHDRQSDTLSLGALSCIQVYLDHKHWGN